MAQWEAHDHWPSSEKLFFPAPLRSKTAQLGWLDLNNVIDQKAKSRHVCVDMNRPYSMTKKFLIMVTKTRCPYLISYVWLLQSRLYDHNNIKKSILPKKKTLYNLYIGLWRLPVNHVNMKLSENKSVQMWNFDPQLPIITGKSPNILYFCLHGC